MPDSVSWSTIKGIPDSLKDSEYELIEQNLNILFIYSILEGQPWPLCCVIQVD